MDPMGSTRHTRCWLPFKLIEKGRGSIIYYNSFHFFLIPLYRAILITHTHTHSLTHNHPRRLFSLASPSHSPPHCSRPTTINHPIRSHTYTSVWRESSLVSLYAQHTLRSRFPSSPLSFVCIRDIRVYHPPLPHSPLSSPPFSESSSSHTPIFFFFFLSSDWSSALVWSIPF